MSSRWCWMATSSLKTIPRFRLLLSFRIVGLLTLVGLILMSPPVLLSLGWMTLS